MGNMNHRLDEWAKALLDLTYRNRLLNLPLTAPSAARQQTLRFQSPDAAAIYGMLLGEGAIAIESPPDPEPEDVLQRHGSEIVGDWPYQSEDSDPPTAAKNTIGSRSVLTLQPATVASRIALRLMRNSRTTLSEQGINSLFATFGVLKWRDSKTGEARRAPLLLVPVELDEDTRNELFRIRRFDESVEFNLTLAERILGDFKLSISPPAPDEGDDFDYTRAVSHVRDQIAGREGWEVEEESHLGLFQFHKLRMVRDLRDHSDIAANHPVIQALATEGMQIASTAVWPTGNKLDQQITSSETYSILDADSSQMEVVEAAKRGASLVVQGPPGTGKSQTIANIIAESIAQRKTVLFVSEKAAALEVVYRRLEQAGLGEYCLPLHSHKANKAEVINDLHACMDRHMAGAGRSPMAQREFAEHDSLRDQLNAYPIALHDVERKPLESTVFSVIDRLAGLSDVPDAVALPIPPVGDLTEEMLESWCSAISSVARVHSVLQEGEDHVWAVVGDRSLSLTEQDDLRSAFTRLKQTLEQHIRTADELSNTLGVTLPASSADAGRLGALADLVPEHLSVTPVCLAPDVANETILMVREARERLGRLRQVTDDMLTHYTESVFSLPHDELLVTYRQGFLSRKFSSVHRQHRKTVLAAAKPGSDLSDRSERDALEQLKRISPELNWLAERANILSARLGVFLGKPWTVDAQRLDSHLAELEQLSRLMDAYPDRQIPETLKHVWSSGGVAKLKSDSEQLRRQMNELSSAVDQLEKILPGDGWRIVGQVWQDVALADLQHWITTRLASFHDLGAWMQAQSALAEVKALGLESTYSHLWEEYPEPDHWVDILSKRVLSRWTVEQMDADSVLGTFKRQEHEQAVARFRELDRRVIESGTQRIHDQLKHDFGYADSGEPQVLQREFNKKRRKLPPRLLFQRIPNLLQELKPCLMMSPLSVAHFLPADRFAFDLVIFDEASQVRPHDAIGAIMRGKQHVVAGDRSQLPPTSFFDRTSSADDTEEDVEENLKDMESVLDALEPKGFRSLPLLWHYRSRHEELIAFSNHFIYDDTLRTFPTPIHGRTPDAGVHFRYVENGRMTREPDEQTNRKQKHNREEVKAVVNLVIEHVRACPDRTLGVVALNTWHADAIHDAIHDAKLLDRQLDEWIERDGEEPFFIKNLEEVQGDERDVMIVSIGFAKEGDGEAAKLNHNFGPINQEVGRRRINVLITRAKHKIILVSSIRDEDIRDSISHTGGLWLLKHYLTYAEKGPDVLEQRVGFAEGEPESVFEEDVANAIRKLGYDVRLQVGVSKYRIDIGVVNPNDPMRFLMGVECDGATYHSSKVARDRDRLRQEVLEQQGWRIHRIWSTEWFNNRDGEVARLARTIDEAIAANRVPTSGDAPIEDVPSSVAQIQAPPSAKRITAQLSSSAPSPREPIDLRVLPDSRAAPYHVANLSKGSIVSELNRTPRSFIESLILQCVEVEGPIHFDLLVRRIASVWGYERAGSRIRSHIEAALNHLIRTSGEVKRSGAFLSLANQVVSTARGTDPDGYLRKIDWIPSEELQVAFDAVLRRALSLDHDEMITETARYLGYNRTGRAIKTRLEEELRQAVAGGLLEVVNGRYQLISASPRQLTHRDGN